MPLSTTPFNFHCFFQCLFNHIFEHVFCFLRGKKYWIAHSKMTRYEWADGTFGSPWNVIENPTNANQKWCTSLKGGVWELDNCTDTDRKAYICEKSANNLGITHLEILRIHCGTYLRSVCIEVCL